MMNQSIRAKWPTDKADLIKDLLARATPFSSLWAWARGDRNSYEKALSIDVHRQIAETLDWHVQPITDWPVKTDDLTAALTRAASPYTSLRSWELGDPGSYSKAAHSGLQRVVAEVLGWEMRAWTDWPESRSDLLQALVQRACLSDGLKDWQKMDMGGYLKAREENLLRAVATQMSWTVREVWPRDPFALEEAIVKRSAGFKDAKEWQENDPAAYAKALETGIMAKIITARAWA